MSFFLAALTRGNNSEMQSREVAHFETREEAIEVSKKMIDEYLLNMFTAGLSAKQLLHLYASYGEVPFIFGDPGDTMSVKGFDHMQYAKTRCLEICDENNAPAPSGPVNMT